MAAPFSNGAIVLLVVTVMVAIVYSASMPTHGDNPLVIDSALHNQLKALIQRRKELAMVRAIMREFDQHLALIHKSTCDINMPGFECGESAIDSGSDGWYWGSENSPGKRKRGCALNLNDGSCDNKKVLGLVSDLNTWMNGPGRRRR